MLIEKGMIVKSIAGHDKDRYYLIVEVSSKSALIADGKRRRLEKPKRKNIKHLQQTNCFCQPNEYKTDKQLRALLHQWNEV